MATEQGDAHRDEANLGREALIFDVELHLAGVGGERAAHPGDRRCAAGAEVDPELLGDADMERRHVGPRIDERQQRRHRLLPMTEAHPQHRTR